MKSIQVVIALAITDATRVSSGEKLYQELGLEWHRKLCYFFKLTKNKSPKYLFNNITTVRSTYRTRNIDNVLQFIVRNTFFRNSYFSSIATEWNNLDKSIRNSESVSIFKLKFIRQSLNSIFNCHNPKGVKLLTRLRLGLSHLHDHKCKRSLQDSFYLLHCPLFSDERLILINNMRSIDNNYFNLNDSGFSEVLLFGNSLFNNTKNTTILTTTIECISSKRFEVSLFDSFLIFMDCCCIYLLFSFF